MRTFGLPQGNPLTLDQYVQDVAKEEAQYKQMRAEQAQVAVVAAIALPFVLFLLIKLVQNRKWIGSSIASALIYVLGRGYRLKKRASAGIGSFADQVKKAAEE